MAIEDPVILYAGIDDSNHAGDRKGDIIAATFSFNKADSICGPFPNTKNVCGLYRWLGEDGEERDFRFLQLFDDNLRCVQPNIPVVAPKLVMDFVNSYDGKIDGLKLYIDGKMARRHKMYLRSFFDERFKTFVVDNFIKHQGVPRKYNNSVYMADTLASDLYSQDFATISEHQKRISVDESSLVDLIREIDNR